LSGKFGKQSLRFRAAKTFFFGITIFLYQNKNPVAHLSHWRQFCASLNFHRVNDSKFCASFYSQDLLSFDSLSRDWILKLDPNDNFRNYQKIIIRI
jgi:hypothetical protein